MKYFQLLVIFCTFPTICCMGEEEKPAVQTVFVENLPALIEVTDVVIVDFYGTWCAPCRRLLPIYEELAEEYANEETLFVKVNMGDKLNNEGWKEYQFHKIPTFIFYRNGTELTRHTGFLTEEALRELILMTLNSEEVFHD